MPYRTYYNADWRPAPVVVSSSLFMTGGELSLPMAAPVAVDSQTNRPAGLSKQASGRSDSGDLRSRRLAEEEATLRDGVPRLEPCALVDKQHSSPRSDWEEGFTNVAQLQDYQAANQSILALVIAEVARSRL